MSWNFGAFGAVGLLRASIAAVAFILVLAWSNAAFAQCTLAVSTTTTVSSSVNPSAFGQPVTFTATVTNSGAVSPCTPTGTVTFYDGATPLGSATLSNGQAKYVISTLRPGIHSIIADYPGDTYNPASTGNMQQSVGNTPYDSLRVRDLQIQATANSARTSGAAITGAIENAISDGFSNTILLGERNGSGFRFGDGTVRTIQDGSSNTINVGERSGTGFRFGDGTVRTIQDGSSNTINVGERGGTGFRFGDGTVRTIRDGSSNTINVGEQGGRTSIKQGGGTLDVGTKPRNTTTQPSTPGLTGKKGSGGPITTTPQPGGGTGTPLAPQPGSGGTLPPIQDGTSNTLPRGGGTTPPMGDGTVRTIQDGTSNTILLPEGGGTPPASGGGTTPPLGDGTVRTIPPGGGSGTNSTPPAGGNGTAPASGSGTPSSGGNGTAPDSGNGSPSSTQGDKASGVTTSPARYAEEPQRSPRIPEAFDALASASAGRRAPPAPPPREWLPWIDVRGSGWEQSSPSGDQRSTQVNVTGGLTRKLSPDLLAGLVFGFETFQFRSPELAGSMTGNGGTIGGYAGWRFAPGLRADASLSWSGIAYSANAGTASGSFFGSRLIASTGVTGSLGIGALLLEPSARLFMLWEQQTAWTDSLGTRQAGRDFATGRASTGMKASTLAFRIDALAFVPYLGLYGDYRFSSDSALPVAPGLVGISDGWSARVTGGTTISAPNGGSLTLGGEVGNLGGGGPAVWTVMAKGGLPF